MLTTVDQSIQEMGALAAKPVHSYTRERDLVLDASVQLR